jgi:hypothetical protein
MDKIRHIVERLGAAARSARDAGPRFDWALSLGLGLAACALYLAARYVFYGYDALAYAEAVERAPLAQLLHPHHLLYDPLCRVVFACAGALGYTGRALGPMHVVSAAAGGVGAASLYLLARTLGAGRLAALLAGAALATAAGYWRNAASIDVYVLAAAAALAALYVAAKVPAGSAKTAALAGGILALAALFHQINFLLVPAAITYALTAGKGRRAKALALGAAFAAGVLAAYVAAPAVLLGLKTPASYADWFFFYARMNRWGGLSPHNALAAADGLARVFYVNTMWDNFIAPFAKGNARYLRVALPLWLAAFVGGANLIAWVIRGPARRGFILVGVAFLTYAAFVFWWLPSHLDYWLVPAACLLAALAVAVSTRRRAWISLVALTLAWAGISNVNWRDGIKPGLHLADSPHYRAAMVLAGFVPRDAPCFLASSKVITHARYFGGLTRAQTPNWAVNALAGDEETAAHRIEESIRRELNGGGTVYVGERAFPGIGGPAIAALGERLLRCGRPVGRYEGAEVSETIYVIGPDDAAF